MTLTVAPGDPRDPGAAALLYASRQMMSALFEADTDHSLDPEALVAPGTVFFVARIGDRTMGVGALVLRDGYGEVKAMYVSAASRGAGVGAALLARLERTARDAGLPALLLETGTALDAARRLYARAGFHECGPFGDYHAHPQSVFMEKRLN